MLLVGLGTLDCLSMTEEYLDYGVASYTEHTLEARCQPRVSLLRTCSET